MHSHVLSTVQELCFHDTRELDISHLEGKITEFGNIQHFIKFTFKFCRQLTTSFVIT